MWSKGREVSVASYPTILVPEEQSWGLGRLQPPGPVGSVSDHAGVLLTHCTAGLAPHRKINTRVTFSTTT